MKVTLEDLMQAARERVAQARKSTDLKGLEREALAHRPRGWRSALERVSKRGPAVIAELKKASPSRGVIRASFRPAALAQELKESGAAALSVLTEEKWFQGSLANLHEASVCGLPCLRKDFIVDELQVLEARANGADAVLLIVAGLNDGELKRLQARARELELDVLCEVHDENELERAIAAGCDTIGVNNRDLRTFNVDLDTGYKLASRMPKHVLRVAESGIHTGRDLSNLRAAGYQAFLIGESLMKADHPGQALKKLLASVKAEGTVH